MPQTRSEPHTPWLGFPALELAWWLAACAVASGIGLAIHAVEPSRGPVVTRRVDVNTAQFDELMTLPGMNARRARAIIKEREKRGHFESTRALMEVKGVTPAFLERIEELIEVK